MDKNDRLASLDQARDRFLAAFEQVPDPALGYLKPGDDYAIGGLLPHVTWVLTRYGRVLDAMVAGGFAELRAKDPPGEMEQVAEQARRGLEPASRSATLAALRRGHAHVAERLRALGDDDFQRTAPVFFDDAGESYLTSAADIAGWLEGHYDEHTPHVELLLAAYREASA